MAVRLTPLFVICGTDPSLSRRLLAVLVYLLSVSAFGHDGGLRESAPSAYLWPLWEMGVFTGAARIPHYRGSDEYTVYVLPVPYLVYRGDLLKVDRDGLRGALLDKGRIEASLSFSGNPPVNRKNRAREGMSELGAILECGGLIKVHLTDRRSPDVLFFGMDLRAATSVDPDDLGMAYQGLHGGFHLVYRNRTLLKTRGTSFGCSGGVDFSDQSYNRYFYDVAASEANPSRPAYRSRGGLGGFSLSFSAHKKFSDRWSVGAFYRWDNISGARFRDSPLVKVDNNHVFGCALIWKIHQSDTVVHRYQGGTSDVNM